MKPELINFCSSGDDKVFSFEEYENYQLALQEHNKQDLKEWVITDIQLKDMKQICIGNTKTNKVLCWFNCVDLEYDYLIELANKMCNNLNNE